MWIRHLEFEGHRLFLSRLKLELNLKQKRSSEDLSRMTTMINLMKRLHNFKRHKSLQALKYKRGRRHSGTFSKLHDWNNWQWRNGKINEHRKSRGVDTDLALAIACCHFLPLVVIISTTLSHFSCPLRFTCFPADYEEPESGQMVAGHVCWVFTAHSRQLLCSVALQHSFVWHCAGLRLGQFLLHCYFYQQECMEWPELLDPHFLSEPDHH